MKIKPSGNWILIGEDYIRYNNIVSVDKYGRWLRAADGRTYLVPQNQRKKILRHLES